MITEEVGPLDGIVKYSEPFINNVAFPMLRAYSIYKSGDNPWAARDYLSYKSRPGELKEAWLMAGQEWMQRRVNKREGKP